MTVKAHRSQIVVNNKIVFVKGSQKVIGNKYIHFNIFCQLIALIGVERVNDRGIEII